MITATASHVVREETRVRVFEFGVRGGLDVSHLRAFVEQANTAGLPGKTPVRLTDTLQASSSYHDVEITASVTKSTVHDTDPSLGLVEKEPQ